MTLKSLGFGSRQIVVTLTRQESMSKRRSIEEMLCLVGYMLSLGLAGSYVQQAI